jgi:hypothetical protein
MFILMHYHKYSITEIENMAPFERDIYVSLLEFHLKREKESREKNGTS